MKKMLIIILAVLIPSMSYAQSHFAIRKSTGEIIERKFGTQNLRTGVTIDISHVTQENGFTPIPIDQLEWVDTNGDGVPQSVEIRVKEDTERSNIINRLRLMGFTQRQAERIVGSRQ